MLTYKEWQIHFGNFEYNVLHWVVFNNILTSQRKFMQLVELSNLFLGNCWYSQDLNSNLVFLFQLEMIIIKYPSPGFFNLGTIKFLRMQNPVLSRGCLAHCRMFNSIPGCTIDKQDSPSNCSNLKYIQTLPNGLL